MAAPQERNDYGRGNRLLTLLTPADLKRIAPMLERVHLGVRESLWEASRPIHAV